MGLEKDIISDNYVKEKMVKHPYIHGSVTLGKTPLMVSVFLVVADRTAF